MPAGRPKKEFDKSQFAKLVGIGCGVDEIQWWFRDENGKAPNIDTISRWCKREFGVNFQEYRRQNGSMFLKIQLRQNQLDLSKKSAAMAIFLGKNVLGQSDNPENLKNDQAINDINNQILSIAELINNPAPDVDIESLEEQREGTEE